jgi:hypothetical protein
VCLAVGISLRFLGTNKLSDGGGNLLGDAVNETKREKSERKREQIHKETILVNNIGVTNLIISISSQSGD